MRRFFLFICLVCLYSCSQQELQKPDFLLGYWNRVNNQPEKRTYEIWRSDFTGIGYTMKGKDTTFVEILSIVEINDTLFLKVEGVNENPTLFKFTEQTKTSFTCENPENEFPKKIQYSLENGLLKAVISAGETSVDFTFVKSF